MPEDPQPKAKFTRDPQALTSEYHKARKQVLLWAGILFIWELVGIDLEKAKEAGGNAGAIITAIKSPQAVPWVLLVLVAYFVFKLWIEWNQCEGRRRETFYSRVDFWSAMAVAFLAYSLYAYQAVSQIQLADLLQHSSRTLSVVAGVGLGMALRPMAFIVISLYRGKVRSKHELIISGMECVVVLFVFTTSLLRGRLNFKFTILGIFAGLASLLFVRFVVRPLIMRSSGALDSSQGVLNT
jgi:hypothetical protein